MSVSVEYLLNSASTGQIAEHLLRCDAGFVPPLSGRVDIKDYAQKIVDKAVRFEAWSGDALVGLVAAYCNDQKKRIAYITSVSVVNEWNGKGIAAHLIRQCTEYAGALRMRQISLEVAENNMPAIKLYEKIGFVTGKANVPLMSMHLYLKNEEEHEQQT